MKGGGTMRTIMVARAIDEGSPISFRCPLDLLEAVESERARRCAAQPGMRVSRSDMIRELLIAALRGGV